jgi:hypothetical protein
MASLTDARHAKAAAVAMLGDHEAVNGIGLARIAGTGYVVKVNLLRPLDDELELPSEIDEVPITWEVVGVIKAR